jgi:hypothetical protein
VSCYQPVGQNHNVESVNKSLENVSKFKYFGNRVTEENCMVTKKELKLFKLGVVLAKIRLSFRLTVTCIKT